MKQPVGMIFTFQIFGYFAAKKAAGHGMLRVAGDFGGAARGIDINDDRAGVGAIQCADRVFLLGHNPSIVAEGTRGEGRKLQRLT